MRVHTCLHAGLALCPSLQASSSSSRLTNRVASHTSRRRLQVDAKKGLSELLSLKQGTADNQKRELLRPNVFAVAPQLTVPATINKPSYADTGVLPEWVEEPQIHDQEGIRKMRAAGKFAAQVLEHAGSLVKPGVTTDEIDRAVHKMIVDNNAYPSPLNYGRFPKSVCTSVNECICHGIPDSRPLQEGDIVNIDVTVFLDGHHGDTSRMFYVGNVSPAAKKLCEVTHESLMAAIQQCGPGVPLKRIGATIQGIADKHKYGVVKDFIGHGVGWLFHSYPNIFHCRNNEPGVMVPGMTFTIEPMLTEGSVRHKMWPDRWTVVTADGKLSAQYEHSLLITESGVEILTQL